MLKPILSSLGALALFAATAVEAKELAFTAALSGDKAPTVTGSKATGSARIVVDTETQTVDLTLDVVGLKIDDLWTKLVKGPMGPIHLHLYGSHDHADPNATVTLVFPTPYGPSYSATASGFRVVIRRFPYGQGALILKSETRFEEFVSSLQSGAVVLNIHTNADIAANFWSALLFLVCSCCGG